jgi:hypothetical protein
MKKFLEIINEESDVEEISDSELDQMAASLTWEDIADLYEADELIDVDADEDELDDQIAEGISAQSRLKKKMNMIRNKVRRGQMRTIKLRRSSDFATLKKRAGNAARRALQRRLLRGRDKSTLSPAEKDRIEDQVRRMKGIQALLATKMMPTIRKLEQKRLYKGSRK